MHFNDSLRGHCFPNRPGISTAPQGGVWHLGDEPGCFGGWNLRTKNVSKNVSNLRTYTYTVRWHSQSPFSRFGAVDILLIRVYIGLSVFTLDKLRRLILHTNMYTRLKALRERCFVGNNAVPICRPITVVVERPLAVPPHLCFSDRCYGDTACSDRVHHLRFALLEIALIDTCSVTMWRLVYRNR